MKSTGNCSTMNRSGLQTPALALPRQCNVEGMSIMVTTSIETVLSHDVHKSLRFLELHI